MQEARVTPPLFYRVETTSDRNRHDHLRRRRKAVCCDEVR